MSKKGFTLVEMMVGVVVVCMIGMFVFGGIHYATSEPELKTITVKDKHYDNSYNDITEMSNNDFFVIADEKYTVKEYIYDQIDIGRTYDVTVRRFLGTPSITNYELVGDTK